MEQSIIFSDIFRKCGTAINHSSYSPCAAKTGCISFIILSWLGVAICIASMIVASDLTKSSQYTQCTMQGVTTQVYEGNTSPTMPWSGVNNLNNNINMVSYNVQDTLPLLNAYFQNSTAFTPVAATGAPYMNSQSFTCPSAPVVAISCPFAAGGTACPTQNSTITAGFSYNFCDGSIANTPQANITN